MIQPEEEYPTPVLTEGIQARRLSPASLMSAFENTLEKGSDEDGNVEELNHHVAQGEEQTTQTATSPRASPPPPSSSSPWWLGLCQTAAMFRKNMLTKLRTPLPTFFEIFSPVLMMLILVAAYTLSEVVYKDEQQFTSIQVDLPGPWIDLVTRAASFLGTDGGLASLTELINRRSLERIVRPPLDETGARPTHNILHGWDLIQDELDHHDYNNKYFYGDEEDNQGRFLQYDEVGDVVVDESVSNSTDNRGDRDIFSVLNDAQNQLKKILKSPMVIPTFSQYVYLSLALSSLIDSDDLPRVLSDSWYGREWGNLLTLGTIHLSPNNQVANDFWEYLNVTYPTVMNDFLLVRVHQDENTAISFINDNLEERTWALLDFSSFDENNPIEEEFFKYKIRTNYTTVPNTNLITDYVSIGLNTQYQRYYLSGYLTLQRTLNAFAFSRLNNNTDDGSFSDQCAAAQNDDVTVWSMPMPTASYSQNTFYQAVGYLLGLTIAMAYLYPTSRLIKSLVEEKETRTKEFFFILGVRPWAHWLSWVLTSFLIFCIITVLVTITLSTQVLKHSSPAYLFAWIGLFSASTIGFCFFVAAFFSRAKLAAIVGPMALFATLLPRFIFFGTNRYEATAGKYWASLLPCTAFTFGADIVADYEYAEQGIQSWNASEGDYSFNTTLGFLFVDTLLYMFLGWYLEQIIPRQYGVARKWYFVFMPSYWCGVLSCLSCNCLLAGKGHKDGSTSAMSESTSEPESDSNDFEQVSDPSLLPRVRIRNLVKRYNSKKDVPPAVDDLNLTMYESQITCLLGHNGAGKTSTISVLTGLFPPTSGDCEIYGNSIVHDLMEARQSMGICPQHNVLFDRLTVVEHLAFFEKIKGIRPTKSSVRERAHEIGLGEYLRTTASALSGGNKRKLSVAIALCGDPKLLMLDEPTSGMDPASRRACWEVLRRKRMGRVTLLVSHFMDEAELLADRIAVMKEGKLQCSGSVMFLKNRFGLGYNLTVVLNSEAPTPVLPASMESNVPVANAEHLESSDASGIRHSSSPSQDLNAAIRIESFLKRHIANTELIRKSARELTYRFPQGTADLFPELFDALEEKRENLGIGAYGITSTTLEEVFLQLAEEEGGIPGVHGGEEIDVDAVVESAHGEPLPSEESRTQNELGVDTIAQAAVSIEDVEIHNSKPSSTAEIEHMSPLRQVALLYRKRFTIQKRDWKGACFTIILPVLLIALVLLVLTISPSFVGPEIEVSMGLYKTSPSGSSGRTLVLVGGGASLLPRNGSAADIAPTYASLSTALSEEQQHAGFQHLKGAVSSQLLSRFLLDTYNDHDHDARYGAFVLEDVINLTVSIDWDAIRNDIAALGDILGSGELGIGDPIKVNGPFRTKVSVTAVTQIIGWLVAPDTANVGDLLAVLSGELGDDSESGDDDLTVEVSSIVVDLVATSVTLLDLRIYSESPPLTLLSLDETTFFLSDITGNILNNTLSQGVNDYYVGINSASTILHNASSPHAVAAFNQDYMEYLYKTCSSNADARLISANHPLPLTTQQSLEIRLILSVLASLFLLIPLCYTLGAFIVFPVKERVCASKHLQLVSGVNMSAYWVATYLWDLSLFLVLTLCIMIVFLLYGQESAQVFVGSVESFFATMALIFGYGMSALPFSYLLSRMFNNPSSAQIAVMGIFFITGFVAVNAYFIMSSIENTKDIAESLVYLFRTWPAYNVGEGFIRLSSSFWEREVLSEDTNPFDWDVTGHSLALLYGLSAPYFTLLLLLECSHDGGSGALIGRLLRSLRQMFDLRMLRWYGVRKTDDGSLFLLDGDGLDANRRDEDEDVAQERSYVMEHKEELKTSASVMIANLWKIYPPSVGLFANMLAWMSRIVSFVCCCGCLRRRCSQRPDQPDEDEDTSTLPKRAVRGLTTAIMKGETYGLLGVNGAGKTTTLGVLTGDITPTSGEAYVAGYDVTGATPGGVCEARKNIGYCPQVNPLLDLMTGRETLRMFGRLRGIPKVQLESTVTELLERLTLTPHADKTSESYSGGNKRKLSLGIALIGDPKVLFIDEASSGMDPAARRHMWSLIEEVSQKRSVMLTTHSMEEAEALCTRVGIMVHGELLCLGSVQHLKTTYLDGYTIDVHCTAGTSEEVIDLVVQQVLEVALPHSRLSERHGRFLRFDVSSLSSLGLGTMFRQLQSLKENRDLCVENYSISQCSLEQVFISLVRGDEHEEEEQPESIQGEDAL